MRTNCIAQGTTWCSGDLNGKKIQKRGYICICVADNLQYSGK